MLKMVNVTKTEKEKFAKHCSDLILGSYSMHGVRFTQYLSLGFV